MGSKYEPLAALLSRASVERLTLSFAQIEQIIGSTLPPSAHPSHQSFRMWWQNSYSGDTQHVQAVNGWHAAGWDVETLDISVSSVIFRKAIG